MSIRKLIKKVPGLLTASVIERNLKMTCPMSLSLGRSEITAALVKIHMPVSNLARIRFSCSLPSSHPPILIHDRGSVGEFHVCVKRQAPIEFVLTYRKVLIFDFLPSDSTELVATNHLPFHRRTFSYRTSRLCSSQASCAHGLQSQVLGQMRNHSSWQRSKTQAAPTHATKFRTRATTTPRADHLHNRRHVLHIIRFSLVYYPFIISLFFDVDHLVYFMLSTIHWFMLSTLMVFSSTNFRILVRTLDPTTSDAMAVKTFRSTAILLVQAHLLHHPFWLHI